MLHLLRRNSKRSYVWLITYLSLLHLSSSIPADSPSSFTRDTLFVHHHKLPPLLLLCFCPLIVIAFIFVSRNFIETFLLSAIELLSADDGYTVRANLRFVLWVGFKFPKQCFVIRWIHVQTFLRSQFGK